MSDGKVVLKPDVGHKCSDCVKWTDDKYQREGKGNKYVWMIVLAMSALAGFGSYRYFTFPAPDISGGFCLLCFCLAIGIAGFWFLYSWFRRNIIGRKLWFFLDKTDRLHCHEKQPLHIEPQAGHDYEAWYWGVVEPHTDFQIPGAIFALYFNGRNKRSRISGNRPNEAHASWSISETYSHPTLPSVTLHTWLDGSLTRTIIQALRLVVKYESLARLFETLEDQAKQVEAQKDELSELRRTLEDTEHKFQGTISELMLARGALQFLDYKIRLASDLLKKWPQDSKGAQAARQFLDILKATFYASRFEASLKHELQELASSPKQPGERKLDVGERLERAFNDQLDQLATTSPTFAKFMAGDKRKADTAAANGS